MEYYIAIKKTNTATHNNLDESHSHYVEQKLDRKEPILHYSIYMKFKKRQKYSMAIEDIGGVIISEGGTDQEGTQRDILGFCKCAP